MVDFSVDTSKNLEDLLKRLKPGQIVKGRILDKLDSTIYIIRIYGYNIISESKKKLNIGEELNFEIKGNQNHLTIKLIHNTKNTKNTNLNIII